MRTADATRVDVGESTRGRVVTGTSDSAAGRGVDEDPVALLVSSHAANEAVQTRAVIIVYRAYRVRRTNIQPRNIVMAVISAVQSCSLCDWYTSYEPFMRARKR